jgi:hypothetical protein
MRTAAGKSLFWKAGRATPTAIVPLIAVLTVVYMGVSTETLANLSRKNIPASKMLLGSLFLVLAALLALM